MPSSTSGRRTRGKRSEDCHSLAGLTRQDVESDGEAKQEDESADWDHGIDLYSRYLGLNSAEGDRTLQREQDRRLGPRGRSVTFDETTSVLDNTEAVVARRQAYCEQWRQRTAAKDSSQPDEQWQLQHAPPAIVRSGGDNNRVAPSLASKLRNLVPPPLPPPRNSILPPTPLNPALSGNHQIVDFSVRGGPLFVEIKGTSGVQRRPPSSRLEPPTQQPEAQSLELPSDSRRHGRSNWVFFDADPLQLSSPPSPPEQQQLHQLKPSPSSRHHSTSSSVELSASNAVLRQRLIAQTSVVASEASLSSWSIMSDEKRASIEVPDSPGSYSTANAPGLYKSSDASSVPAYPYREKANISESPSQDTSPDSTASATPTETESELGPRVKKDLRFWMIFSALMLIAFIAALDMTMISTALPSITSDLPPSTIAANWVTSAFLLPMVASQPIFGGLSCSIGRPWSINSALVIFLVGSVVCATSKSFLMLVVGRGIQGLGGGGIHAMCEIIMSDLTTLRERGLYFGLIALVFAVAGFAAPVLGGAFSEHSWPWIFWINLPIGAVALVMLIVFLKIKVPLLTGKERWQRLDLVGNAILFGSVTSILIAVTEGGIKYPWSSWQIWVPLVVGLLGMGLFLVIEWVPNRISPKPVFPLDLFQNRTAAFAYLQTFLHGVIFYGVIYIVPIYFQAIKDRTPLQSAIWSFPMTAPSFPLAMAAGILISVTGKYKLLIFAGWILMAAGVGWMTHWHVATSKLEWAFSQVIAGAGLGILFPITLPPIQAALPSSRLESATAAYAFTRTFGAVWGITAATTIFSTQTAKNLRPYYAQLNPLGLTDFTVIAFSESLRHLPQPIQGVVKRVYADAISDSYWLFVPLAIIGFATTFGMRELPLPDFIKSEAKMEQKEDSVPALASGAEHAVVGIRTEVPSTVP
ncbi:major facilitator super [Pseudozyma hubeiensis SY62]|uniref:MFS-type efflux pump MMF1 n=1 Tax=Pseudozyma hubeiensis (strain SY62) TaxID=1305764 RepID=R9P5C2_PSEHS|nr:major facilitator super [Pseudozyma hubeiensis SY62]GAC96561.1 major facilitator super [Pseudozyma hubeiensis SY62]